jgi:hypothetical protein
MVKASRPQKEWQSGCIRLSAVTKKPNLGEVERKGVIHRLHRLAQIKKGRGLREEMDMSALRHEQ